jgi:pimeloyl-ACP methyl ester carboxylesterase
LRARIDTADGYTLHAESHGAGMPVVFSNPLCTTTENWRAQVAPFVASGLRVILWDYRGHGQSDAPEDPEAYTLEHVLDDFERVLDWATPAAPAVLLGLSFGGLASLQLALSRPERVRALVLVGSGPGFKDAAAQARWQTMLGRTADLIEHEGMQALLAGRAARTLIGRRPELPAARAAGRAIARQCPRGVALFARQLGAPSHSVIDRLRDVSQPALILIGEKDTAFLRAAELMTSRLPDAECVRLADAGHIVNIEQPAAFEAAVLDFLGRLGPGSRAAR